MREFIQKLKTYAPIIGVFITADGYRRTVESDKISKRYENAAVSLEQTNQKLENLYSDLLNKKQSVNMKDVTESATQSRINELLEKFRNANARIKQYSEENGDPESNQSMIENIKLDAERIVERLSLEVEELAETKVRKSLELEDILKSISDNTDVSKFMPMVDNLIDKFNYILSNISTAQMGALSHILFGISVYYIAINIATAYYGDRLIIYFKLEEKYPWLAKWIKYRRIYQHFNIAHNLILLIVLAGYMIFVNVSVFKYL